MTISFTLSRYETRVIRDDGHLRRDSGAREHRVNLHEVNVRDNVGANIARQTNSWKAMQTVQRGESFMTNYSAHVIELDFIM